MHYPVFFVYFSVIRERHARGGKIGNLTTEDTGDTEEEDRLGI